MNEPGNAELRAHFEQLREDDSAQAPAFRVLWVGAESDARTIRRATAPALLWLAAAAGIVLATGIALLQPGEGAPSRLAANTPPALSSWKSPTAGLLRTSGRELLASPSLHSSLLGGVPRAPVQRKGDPP